MDMLHVLMHQQVHSLLVRFLWFFDLRQVKKARKQKSFSSKLFTDHCGYKFITPINYF